jgi:DNA-binding ferritin-like protein
MLDEYHSELNSYIDEVGEMILMLHGDLPSFHDLHDRIMNNSDTFTLLSGNITYDIPKVLENTRTMFTQLISLYDEAIKADGLPGDIVNKLQEHQYWLRKETRYKLDSYLAQ